MTGRGRGPFIAGWLMISLLSVWRTGAVAQAQSLLQDPRAEFKQAVAEFDEAQRIQAAQPDRALRLFRSSAERFENLIALGIVNGRLEFNLGNAYFQSGDLGRAMLHYLRALRLIPGDPLLLDNLSLARSRCLTPVKPASRGVIGRYFFFWHHDASLAGRTRCAIGLYVAFWFMLTLRFFVPRRGVTAASVVFLGAAVMLGCSAAYDRWKDRNTPEGVVVAMDVPVYKGPVTGYQRQFEQPLQPGTEFTLLQTRVGWWNIRLADDNTGWIEASAAELVAGETAGADASRAGSAAE